jgi:hypothetical protein
MKRYSGGVPAGLLVCGLKERTRRLLMGAAAVSGTAAIAGLMPLHTRGNVFKLYSLFHSTQM